MEVILFEKNLKDRIDQIFTIELLNYKVFRKNYFVALFV